ncbi:ORF58e [Rhynchospora pubera]|uniref:ORF58e n=1 Tax=Rhynchospora pubera TaxID=906938 RepID=A0AAV8AL70_9POAL|nr:ORF58e [Rhynchospora pubera]
MKLKGIDGGPHKRWSMWFNSMQSEEPYQGLTCRESLEREECLRKRGETRTQVVHGCRQFVP